MIIAGYYRKQERDANLARNVIWYIKHFGGMGNADADTPKDLWPLNMDQEDTKQMITTLKMALDLIKEF